MKGLYARIVTDAKDDTVKAATKAIRSYGFEELQRKTHTHTKKERKRERDLRRGKRKEET